MSRRSDVKTNAMRALGQRHVAYEAYAYDEAIKTADGVADALRVPAGEVFKTLVLIRPGGRPILLMVPGDKEVQMRVLARAIGVREVRLAPRGEAERLTGLQTGGIGALALLHKQFDVFIDRAALAHDSIFVNGGRRGLNLRLRVADLLAVTGARPVEVEGR